MAHLPNRVNCHNPETRFQRVSETRSTLAEGLAWATKAGEYIGSRPRLLDALETRGFEAKRNAYGRGFMGLALKRDIDGQ